MELLSFWNCNDFLGHALGKAGIPIAGVWGVGGPVVDAVTYVLFGPTELTDGTLPDQNDNGILDILENPPQPIPEFDTPGLHQ
ncbi:MAG: hypothetical protein GY710_01460 [Desulfobacteraceae bacterium]|nr:hypothetical protein [Desulfobacteraceae bacterium]